VARQPASRGCRGREGPCFGHRLPRERRRRRRRPRGNCGPVLSRRRRKRRPTSPGDVLGPPQELRRRRRPPTGRARGPVGRRSAHQRRRRRRGRGQLWPVLGGGCRRGPEGVYRR
ncbi:unnamed protein product, partial [Ectocarpus sp. 8 AP-2014]